MSQRLTCGYHCTAKPISFGRGQSAVHTAAYNARTQLEHEREGRLTRDYSTHEGALLFSGIFAPTDAPAWTQDRNQLWNRAEAAERQKVNGQPARNVIAAFPHELNQQQREWLIKDFAREQFARRGMIADVAMHGPDAGGDQRNTHAHILLTMRRLDGDSFAKTKSREWNSKEQLDAWRTSWAEKGAQALHRAGHPIAAERWRHGHETLEKQRAAALKRGDREFADSLEREATIHKGAKLTGMERRGAFGDMGDRMDEAKSILDRNELRFDIKEIDRELKALEQAQTEQQKRDEQARADAARAEADRRQAIEKQQAAQVPPPPQKQPETQQTRSYGEIPLDPAYAEELRRQAIEKQPAAHVPPPPQKQPEPPQTRPYGEIPLDPAYAEELRRQQTARAAETRRAEAPAKIQAKVQASPSYRVAEIKAEPVKTAAPAAPPQAKPAAPKPQHQPPQAQKMPARAPSFGLKAPGLQVLDSATGAITRLGDFVFDFLAGSPPPKPVNMAFTTDPAVRKQQQMAQVGAARAAKADEMALERIADDLKGGRNLKAEDIRHLTHEHQMQIHTFGDSAVQQMVDDIRKRSKGYERERD